MGAFRSESERKKETGREGEKRGSERAREQSAMEKVRKK